MVRPIRWGGCWLGLCLVTATALASEPAVPLRLLFLGDNGHHRPADRFAQLAPVLARRGIQMTYTDQVTSLAPATLKPYDGLVIYANLTELSADQEQALLDYVAGGKGLIALHCASYCFLNSPRYVDLVGAQFQRHETGTFRTEIVAPDHPLMKDYGGFLSWDETYVHHRHNERDRTVLEVHVDGDHREPWTWVRTQGRGRVFYTAWGHDHRTWGNPGFQNLIERGIRWATGGDPAVAGPYLADLPFPVPETTQLAKDVQPFSYIDVGKKIPNYTPSRRWGTQGEAFSRMQEPLPPAESMKHLVVPAGFRVELFASEPDLGGKPIAMTWDERGRLWVAETYDYPNQLQPRGAGRDRIRICEDTDGDGHADKFTVFADKLSIPTSLFVAHGGAIVFEGTKTMFLRDTDGDDVADERQELFGDWALNDTHGGPSNMQYGLDNWIWAMQGYNQSRLKVGGETQEFRMGFFRFKPDASRLEFIRSTNNNTWGFGLSEDGLIFGSTANGNPSIYMPIANRYYEAVRGWTPSLVLSSIADSNRFRPITDKVRQVDNHGGYTAGAGHALYTARAYPREYWNHISFVCEPTGHLVGMFLLERDGADVHATSPANLLASNDEWTAPIMAEVGPDGYVWVIDWYNYIVQHNPTPIGFQTGKGSAYETDLRDKKHGRIYRVVYEPYEQAHQGTPRFTLAGATPQQLVAALRNDNLFWRRQAQRLLVERGQLDILPDLIALASDRGVDELGLNAGATHALWTMHGLGALDRSHPEALAAAVAALQHPSAGVRRNAVQVLPPSSTSARAILEAGLLTDGDSQVRLAALLALADQPPSDEVGRAVAEMLAHSENTEDRWLPDAITSAGARHAAGFLPAAVAGVPQPRGLEVIGIVAEHYGRGAPTESVGGLLAALVDAQPGATEALVRGLARGWPADQHPPLDAALDQTLDRLLERLPSSSRGQLVKLARTWGSQRVEKYAAEVAATLLKQIEDDSLAANQRISAARELCAFRGEDAATMEHIVSAITPRTPPAVATGILQAMGASRRPETGRLLVERLPGLTPTARSAALAVLLTRADWTRAVLDGVNQGRLQIGDLALDQRQALAAHPDRAIREAARELLARGGALPSPDRQKVLDVLLPVAQEHGDAGAGKVVFTKHCAKCHQINGEGARIGPDLTGMAVHPKSELLTSILDPSRSVEGNFRVYTLATVDGKVLSGLLASESRTAVELFDSEGKKLTVLREDIDELVASTKSLMPEGFEQQVSRAELRDLLEFLTQRGQYTPLDLRKVATISSARGMFYSTDAVAERLIFPDWSPQTFSGVPFLLLDPQDGRVPNVVMLNSPNGEVSQRMPQSVEVPCTAPIKALHLLSGISGWGFPASPKGTVSLIVRLHYADGKTEDHALRNGEEFADYIRRVDVPGSEFACALRGRQVRYLKIEPQRAETVQTIEFVKGEDRTAPIIMAATVENAERGMRKAGG